MGILKNISSFANQFYQRKLLNSRYLGRVGVITGYLLVMTIMMPQSFRVRFEYEVGKPWQESDLYAPFAFPILKSQDSVQAQKKAIVKQVRKIFKLDTANATISTKRVYTRLEEVFSQLESFNSAANAKDTSLMSDIQENYFFSQFKVTPKALNKALNKQSKVRLFRTATNLTDSIYKRGLIRFPNKDTLGDVISLRFQVAKEKVVPVAKLLNVNDLPLFVAKEAQTLNPQELNILQKIIQEELEPNYIYSEKLTLKEIERRVSLISPVYGKVNKGQPIIIRGERVDKETDAVLRSLMKEKADRFGDESRWSIFLSQMLLIFLITLILLVYLSVNRPRIYFNNPKLSLILSTFLLVVGSMTAASHLTEYVSRFQEIVNSDFYMIYIYMAPACIVPIFICNFFGQRTAFLCNLLTALYGGILIRGGLEFVFVQTIAGSVALYSMRRLRKREFLFYTLAYIFVAYSVSYLAYNLYSKGNFYDINYTNFTLFFINILITALTYNLMYVYERMFGVTSDLTFLELLDTNHSLLQELANKAPGTFQHSLQVASIAESTINVIGGNGLLTHVGALYHDLGKMKHPYYFIENMSSKEDNPHNDIDCEESAEIIIGHVQEGVEIALKHGLPKEIIEFIETHHGTTRVEYFYRLYLKKENCESPENEGQFRYKGPRPFSKETAVLMIADSVEAASRAVKNLTPEKVRNLVDGIIDHKIKDKQLENSNLTFKDIATIREVMCKQIMNIHHSRLEYPDEKEKEPVAVKN